MEIRELVDSLFDNVQFPFEFLLILVKDVGHCCAEAEGKDLKEKPNNRTSERLFDRTFDANGSNPLGNAS